MVILGAFFYFSEINRVSYVFLVIIKTARMSYFWPNIKIARLLDIKRNIS